MNMPSLSELKTTIINKVTSTVTDKVMENFGGNPLGEDFSTVKNMFTGLNLESFNKLSMEEKISKGLVLGGAGLAGVGLLGVIGKSAGVDFLSDFSSNTFPIVLGVGALAAVAGLAIPMYEKYKQHSANQEAGLNGSTQVLDKDGKVISNGVPLSLPSKLNTDVFSKVDVLENKFSQEPERTIRLPVPKPA